MDHQYMNMCSYAYEYVVIAAIRQNKEHRPYTYFPKIIPVLER